MQVAVVGARMRRCAAAMMLLSAGSCSGPAVEFADWTIPVPDGTPIIEHVGVPLGDRLETFELIEDLVIDASDGDLEKTFYDPSTVSIDADSGRIYVYDAGNYRIQVFARDGAFVRSIGREGPGPGELQRWGGTTAIAAGRLVHLGRGRFNVWDLAGNFVHATNSELTWLIDTQASPAARLLGVSFDYPEDWPESPTLMAFSRINPEGQAERRYLALPDPDPPFFERPDGSNVNSGAPMGSPEMAASPAGDLYFTAGDEYQVLATDVEGDPRWAMRVAWSRLPLTDADIVDLVTKAREWIPDASRYEIDWPERKPALVGSYSLQVDGHGHLFVFPYYPDDWPEETQPVDVFSPDGRLLFSGAMPRISWRAAEGDYIYALDPDDTEEIALTRYRIAETLDGH